jgi:hypothetical protein
MTSSVNESFLPSPCNWVGLRKTPARFGRSSVPTRASHVRIPRPGSWSQAARTRHPLASVAGLGVHAGVGPQYDLGVVLRHGDRPVVHVGQRSGPNQRPRVLQVTTLLALLVRVGVPASSSIHRS